MVRKLIVCAFVGWLTARAQTSLGWKLVWSDEFSGVANSPPDSTKWGYDVGNGPPNNPGWGNGESEVYTTSTANAFQDGEGHLVIRAINQNGTYTSARIKTQNKFAFTYGIVEARIELPYAQGIWPAFWLLGADIATGVQWPSCGEVDVAEDFGVQNGDAFVNHGTIHGPGYAGAGVTATYTLPDNETISSDFHVFSINWSPGSIEFLVDGVSYLKATPQSLPPGGRWVFDENPMFLLLNLAVGGSPAPVGYPDSTTQFPQQVLVDYVRVYQQVVIDAAAPNLSPDGVVNAASFAPLTAPGALASVSGVNLSDAIYDSNDLFNATKGQFSTSTNSRISVAVNGIMSPLVYVSPTQINFQMPWETSVSAAPANIQVFRGPNASYPEPVAVSSSAPGAFLDFTTGLALVTNCTRGSPLSGATCVIWGNGFGPKNAPQHDGVPASAMPPALFPLEVPGSPASCELMIAGQSANVLYCGTAPGELIDQLNFIYPSAAPKGTTVDATLTINGVIGELRLPVPK